MLRRLVLVTATLFLATAGCKQGEGERCQVTSDCEDGLQCSASIPSTCVAPGNGGSNDGGVPDAEIPPDSMPPDAEPPLPQCSDTLDNEATPDLLIDFPADPECADAADNDESVL